MLDDVAGTGVIADIGSGDTSGAGDGTPTESGQPGGTEGGTPPGSETPSEGGAPGEEEPAEGGEPEPEPEGDADDFEMDGRKVDAKTREALAALKKLNPEAAKRLAENYHRSNAIIKDLGVSNLSEAMNKIRGMSATMEALGGEEGITALNEEVTDYRNEIAQFAKGDTGLIQQLYEGNPEGLELSTTAAIQFLASRNAEAFDRVVIPAIVDRLDKAGMYGAVNDLAELIKEGKGQDSYDLLMKMTKWMGDAKTLRKQQLEVKDRKDPEREKLETERAELAREKAAHYDSQINSHLNGLCNKSMARTVEPFFKDLKLPTEGRREFVNALQSRIWKAIKADGRFQLQAKTIKGKGDPAATAEFAAGKFAELLPEQFRQLRNQLYPAYKPRTLTTPQVAPGRNGAPPPPPAKVIVAPGARPRHDQVDWSKTDQIMWITGNAILTNGKQIKFDVNSAPNRI